MPTRKIKTKYFMFHQNNSGGSFDINDAQGIGPRVWIEAADSADANRRAQDIGIYFDGCANGRDCDCCGDRWSEQWRDDGESKVKVNREYDFSWHDAVYVHHLDGSIERIKAQGESAS